MSTFPMMFLVSGPPPFLRSMGVVRQISLMVELATVASPYVGLPVQHRTAYLFLVISSSSARPASLPELMSMNARNRSDTHNLPPTQAVRHWAGCSCTLSDRLAEVSLGMSVFDRQFLPFHCLLPFDNSAARHRSGAQATLFPQERIA